MQYNPNLWKGSHFEEIFAEILENDITVSKNLVRVLDDIKYEQFVTTMEGDIPLQAYSDDPQTPSDTIKFGDAVVNPKKVMVHTRFTPEQLRSTRFNKDMKSGAANVASNDFETKVINYITLKTTKSYFKAFYQSITAASQAAIAASNTATASQKAWAAAQTPGYVDGIVAKAILSGKARNGGTGALTSATLIDKFEGLMTETPTAVYNSSESIIYADEDLRMLIDIVNKQQQFRDVFTVSGDSYKFLNKAIEFVQLPSNGLYVARTSDNVLATDLLSDVGSFEVGKVNNEGDRMFIKGVMTLDAAVLVPQQKVLYL